MGKADRRKDDLIRDCDSVEHYNKIYAIYEAE